MIDRDTIKRLAAVEDPWAVSLYVPKEEEGDMFAYDELQVKKLVNEVDKLMETRDMPPSQRQAFQGRLDALLARPHFFNRYQAGTLAIFVSPSRLEAVDVPLQLDEFVYLGEEFYLRPIVALLNDLERYLVLAVGPESVYLYEGTSSNLTQLANLTPFSDETGTPEKLGQIDGTDSAAPPLHVKSYLQKVDDRLRQTVADAEAPLIIAGTEWLVGAYRQLSRYGNILPKGIPFQAQKDDRKALVNRAKPLVEEYMRECKAAKRRDFIQEMLKGNASISLIDILAAAVEGQVANLYLDRDEDSAGVFKPAIKFAKVGETKESGGDTALFNLAAIKTFLRGGSVYDLPRKDLPDTTTSINATFRGDGDPDFLEA